MSVAPTRGPVQRPGEERDFTEIFQRLDDLERVRFLGWLFNTDNEGGWGYLQFNECFDLDLLPDPLAVGGDWGAVFEDDSGCGFLIGSTTLLSFLANNEIHHINTAGGTFVVTDSMGSALVTYTG